VDCIIDFTLHFLNLTNLMKRKSGMSRPTVS